MRILWLVRVLPYFLFFLCVLVPVGAVCYAAGALGRTARENLKSGWSDHG